MGIATLDYDEFVLGKWKGWEKSITCHKSQEESGC